MGVVLATYNGARFLPEQLLSLSTQTRLPDHIVVSDDGSTDDTLSIVADFRDRFPGRVDILCAKVTAGPISNFLRGAEMCEADIIAFCDQDDVWLPCKLAICESAMMTTPSWATIHSVEHFRETTGGVRKTVSRTLVPARTVDGLQIGPHRVFRGMSIVVRKPLLALGWPLKLSWDSQFDAILKDRPLTLSDRWSQAHDMFALMTARLIGNVTFVRDVLVHQRWHDTNFSAGGSGWTQDEKVSRKWGKGADAGHLALSCFCRDFAATVEQCESFEIPNARRILAIQHFERWTRVWRARASVHARSSSTKARMAALSELTRLHCYKGIYDRGLGPKALARDLAATIGMTR